MYSPTTRVLTVLELLQTHGRMSGVELAKRLEVDVRTLRRYITRLDELGIPVTSERGAGTSSAGVICATICVRFGWIASCRWIW